MPWWSCGRRGWLGSRGTIVGYVPNLSDGTATVTFEYTDYACDVTLLPAQLIMPAGPLQALPCSRWRVFNVPYDSFIAVLMHSTSGLYNVVTMQFRAANPRCASLGTITGLHPNYGQIGAECLSFKWGVDGAFPWGYRYALERVVSNLPVAFITSGTLPADATSIAFDSDSGIVPSQVYRLTLEGACNPSASQVGTTETTVAITAPGPQLGSDVILHGVVEIGEQLYVRLEYDEDVNCFCVENVTLTANGVAASTIEPPFWTFLLPNSGTVSVTISAQAVTTSTTPSPCFCISPQTLNTTGSIYVPPPGVSCDGVEITGLENTPAGTTASCLTFVWDWTSGVVSYSYELAVDAPLGAIVAQGKITVPNPSYSPSVQIPGLQPSTAYTMTVTGNCTAGGTTASAFVSASTHAAIQPEMGQVDKTAISPVRIAAGLYNVQIPYTQWSCVGNISLVAESYPGQISFQSNVRDNTLGIVYNVPANVTIQCYFQGSPDTGECLRDCYTEDDHPIRSPSFRYTTPPGTSCQTIEFSVTVVCATQINVSWNVQSGVYTRFNLVIDGNPGFNIRTDESSFNQTFDVHEESTYEVHVIATCSTGGQSTTPTTTVVTPRATPPSLASLLSATPNWTGVDVSVFTLDLSYPISGAQCVQTPTLQYAAGHPSFGAIVNPPTVNSAYYVWRVPSVPLDTTVYLELTAEPFSTCGCEQVDPPPQFADFTSPSTPPTPPQPSNTLYTVTMTNYGGPPKLLTTIGALSGTSDTDPSLNGYGDATVLGSYLNQWTLHDQYAWHIVKNFIEYNCQRQFSYNLKPYAYPRDMDPTINKAYYFTLAAVYYGIAGDPCSGGLSKIHTNTQGGYEAKRAYSFCDSSLGGPGAINPGTLRNFAFPPMLAFFKRLITYNWNVAKGLYNAKNPKPIQLAVTYYGSKKVQTGDVEQWFFDADIDRDGYIVTNEPSDPTSYPSVINGVGQDGNAPWDPKFYTAGWNCMERWFMYTAYCNQQLRLMIREREIVSDDDDRSVMTLDDIGTGTGQVDPKCCQISAITCDGEGNGFPNACDWLMVKPAEKPDKVVTDQTQRHACNNAIQVLWDKWINQKTLATLPSPWGTPGLFRNVPDPWTTNTTALSAPYPRPADTMPSEYFDLDCAFSCTTTSLIPGMAFSDLGDPQLNAINAVFPEIYDTSDQGPYAFLGTNFPNSAPFSSKMYSAAFPQTSSDPNAKYPAQFLNTYGVWDNLVGPSGDLTPIFCGTPSSGPPPLKGGATVFTDSSKPYTPLMQTSQCTPWQSNTDKWALYFGGAMGSSDSDALAWALESSRYDLYNGRWAAGIASNPSLVDYSGVKQGALLSAVPEQDWSSVIDGGTIWADLSTGLKPRVANNLVSLTPAAAQKVIWMLSTQSGPFVNNAGVEFSARSPATSVTDSSKWLTFQCPNTALNSGNPWPGWVNMQGQWYGPGTSANAGIVQTYATDQFFNGKVISTTPPFIQPADMPTGSTEDNFGVFHDFGIIAGAWARMALDMTGQTLDNEGQPISKDGIMTGSGSCVYPADQPVSLGCYELAFLPLSWYNPDPVPYPT
jgi:hypothetical protein